MGVQPVTRRNRIRRGFKSFNDYLFFNAFTLQVLVCKHFINLPYISPYPHHHRAKLLSLSVEPSVLQLDAIHIHSVASPGQDEPHAIIETLSKPVAIDKYDILSDEMAALVSKHAAVDQDNQEVVTALKPPQN